MLLFPKRKIICTRRSVVFLFFHLSVWHKEFLMEIVFLWIYKLSLQLMIFKCSSQLLWTIQCVLCLSLPRPNSPLVFLLAGGFPRAVFQAPNEQINLHETSSSLWKGDLMTDLSPSLRTTLFRCVWPCRTDMGICYVNRDCSWQACSPPRGLTRTQTKWLLRESSGVSPNLFLINTLYL